MKLLIINPNISESVTALIEKEARLAAAPDTEITMLTAPMGVAYIETRFEAMIAAYAVAELAAEHAHQHDAVILAAFGDPGLEGLREALDIPVLGMTESALMSACMLGKRFSIIAISKRITAWYRDMVERNGLIDRLASIRCLDEPLRDIGSVQDDHAARLQALCEAAVSEDGADVLIIAGARWRAWHAPSSRVCRCQPSMASPAPSIMRRAWSRWLPLRHAQAVLLNHRARTSRTSPRGSPSY